MNTLLNRHCLGVVALAGLIQIGTLPTNEARAQTSSQGQATKRAWEAMNRVDARTSLIAKAGDHVRYWEAFHNGYVDISRDGIDPDLARHLRDWIDIAADYHRVLANYTRSRARLQAQLDDLGPLPLDDPGQAFLWGLRAGYLNKQISNLDEAVKGQMASLNPRKSRLEQQERQLKATLGLRYGLVFGD
jgi:hypothetical protein